MESATSIDGRRQTADVNPELEPAANIRGGRNAAGRRVSIAVMMTLTAIVAVNFALFRLAGDHVWMFQAPPFVFTMAMLDLALVQAVALGRPLRTFYFTLLFAGAITTGVVMFFSMMTSSRVPGGLRILETAIRVYAALRRQTLQPIPVYAEFPWLGAAEQWLGSLLALLPALMAAALASRWMRCRRGHKSTWGQIVTAFFQGALIGVAISWAAMMLAYFWFGLEKLGPQAGWYAVAAMSACSLVGGLVVATLARHRLRNHQGVVDPMPG
jgi:hypothetical protein